MLEFLSNINLSLPAGIVTVIVAIILIFFVLKLFGGVLRVLITILLFAVIIGVIYILITKPSVIGSAISNVLPSLFLLRCKNGFWSWKKEEKD